jgi:transcriptional regulator with XRE-family HTH domain
MNTVGTSLREIRNGLNKTLDQMSDETGVPKSTLSRLENGKINCPPAYLEILAKAYGVNPSQIQGSIASGIKPGEDEDVLDLIRVISRLKLDKFSLSGFLFLIRTRRYLHTPMHAALIQELLQAHRNQS